jgi:hypothetical protein
MSQPFPPSTGQASTEFDPFSPGFTVAADNASPSNSNNNGFFPSEPTVPARRGPWGAWLRLTSPRPTAEQLRNAVVRERVRRAQVLSGLLLMVLILSAILAPNAVIPAPDPGTIGGLGFLVVTIIICAIFNRRGNVTTAGVVFVASIAGAITITIFGTPAGLGLQDMPDFDLFAIPVVLAGVLLPRVYSIITWFVVSAFTTIYVIFAPEQPNLVHYIGVATIYVAVARPIILAGFLAVISWIAAGSVQRAIFQEDKNAEVERAYAALADQKQRLDEAISVIQGVHARVANGDLTARAPIVGGELVPLTISLNLMLERLNRLQIAENNLGNLEISVQHLSQVLNELAQGYIATPVPAATNFGRLGPIALNLEQLRSGFVQVARNSRIMTDRVNAAIQEVVTTSNALSNYLLQYATVDAQLGAREMQERLQLAEQDLAAQVGRLSNFLGRFTT